MNQLKKRLDALESAERSAPHFPDMMLSLMLSYATPAERVEWEATGRPKIGRATIEAAIARRTRWWYERKTATG